MKERLQGVVIGIIFSAMCAGGIAIAKNTTEQIEVTYDNIKVYKDNVLCEAKDANGKTIEPFIYNGTTYLPVRGAAQLADMRVTWDGATKSIYLWDEMSEDGNLYAMEVCPPYETYRCDTYMASDGKSFIMANKKYTNGFSLHHDGYAYFNLNGKYSSMEFTLGHVDGTNMDDRTYQFFVDGKMVYEHEASAADLPKSISIPLNYGLQLRIVRSDGRESWATYGFGNIVLKK